MGIFYNKNKIDNKSNSSPTFTSVTSVDDSELTKLRLEIKNLKSKYSNYISPEYFDSEVSILLKKEIVPFEIKIKELQAEITSLEDIIKRKDLIIAKFRHRQ